MDSAVFRWFFTLSPIIYPYIFVGQWNIEYKQQCYSHMDTKNGIPLYPNLVNLKSNTMKNTVQR